MFTLKIWNCIGLVSFCFLCFLPQNVTCAVQSPGYLGVDLLDAAASSNEAKGAYVLKVYQGSPAEVAGLMAGDIILKLNGIPINNKNSLLVIMATLSENSTAYLSVSRDDSMLKLIATLTAKPTQALSSTSNSASTNESTRAASTVPNDASSELPTQTDKPTRVSSTVPDDVSVVDKIVFESALLLNVIEGYQSYVRRYPRGQFIARVNDSLISLQAAIDKSELKLYSTAKKTKDLALYKEYATRYPNGSHFQDAQKEIAVLEEKEQQNRERQQEIDDLIQGLCSMISSLKVQKDALANEKSIGERSGYPRYSVIADLSRTVVYTTDYVANGKAKYLSLTGKKFNTSLCPKNDDEASEEPIRSRTSYRRFVTGERVERGENIPSSTATQTIKNESTFVSSVPITIDGVSLQCKRVEEKWPNGNLKTLSYVTEFGGYRGYHGVWRSWYENGNPKQACAMKQNSQYGLNIEWYENGLEKLDGIFVDGKKEGIFYSWGETGNGQRQDCIYEKDVLKGCQ